MTETRAALGAATAGPRPWLAWSAALLLVVPPLAGSAYLTSVAISILLFGVLGAIYDLMIGYAGLSNFGFAGFLAVGAYTAALGAYHYDVNPWLGLALGGLACAAVGGLTALVTLRLRGLYLALVTWFVGEAIRLTISNAPDYTRGALGLSVDPFPSFLGLDFDRGGNALSYYYLILVLGGAIMLAMHLLVRSRTGLAFAAIREDQLATESLGLNASRYKLLNFTVASFFIGLMGAFYAFYLGILTPSPEEFGVSRTVEILTIAYVGGRGTLWGSLFAALLLVGVEEVFRGLGPWRLVLFGILLILVMIYFPKGLTPLVRPRAKGGGKA